MYFERDLACIAAAVRNLAHPDLQMRVESVPYDEGPSEFMLSAEDMPWTSDYFPFQWRGIAARWMREDTPTNQDRREGRVSPADYAKKPGKLPLEFAVPGELYNKKGPEAVVEQLKLLTPEQMNEFSAIEKFDILKGDYAFTATTQELRSRGPDRAPPPKHWEGFCNGVCAASINLHEPKTAVKLEAPNGLAVTFEPNDIKALASASYFYVERYAAVGSPNRTDLKINFFTLPDPAVLDWALTHYLGRLHKPFVMNTFPGPEIWNHVAIGYNRKLINLEPVTEDEHLTPDIKWKVLAQVNITHNDFVDPKIGNRLTAPETAKGWHQHSRYYQYELFLDKHKKIVGGRWPQEGSQNLPTTDAPGFLWFPAGKGTDSTEGANPYIDFGTIENLVERSSQAQPPGH